MGITLRKRHLKKKATDGRWKSTGKWQLYLDIYRSEGDRATEALHLFLYPGKGGMKAHNENTWAMAKTIAALRQREFEAGLFGLPGTHRRKQNFIDYCEAIMATRKTENTRLLWKNALNQLTDYAGEDITFAALTPEFFAGLESHLLDRVSINSASIYFTVIRAAINKAKREGILAVDPSAHIRFKKVQRLPIFLTTEEIQILLVTPCQNEQVKSAFLFSCFTGLRFSDIRALTWEEIKGDQIEYRQKKTGSPEILPLSGDALAILGKQQRTSEKVFPIPGDGSTNYALRMWGKKALIKKQMSFHKARHTFATRQLSSGTDIYTTSKLLGHKNLSTTQIYAQVIDSTKREAVDRVPRLIQDTTNHKPMENDDEKGEQSE